MPPPAEPPQSRPRWRRPERAPPGNSRRSAGAEPHARRGAPLQSAREHGHEVLQAQGGGAAGPHEARPAAGPAVDARQQEAPVPEPRAALQAAAAARPGQDSCHSTGRRPAREPARTCRTQWQYRDRPSQPGAPSLRPQARGRWKWANRRGFVIQTRTRNSNKALTRRTQGSAPPGTALCLAGHPFTLRCIKPADADPTELFPGGGQRSKVQAAIRAAPRSRATARAARKLARTPAITPKPSSNSLPSPQASSAGQDIRSSP
jgi:hypothetical protein